MNCRKIWKDDVVAFRVTTPLFARWNKETQKNLRQCTLCPFLELNRVPQEYKLRALAL